MDEDARFNPVANSSFLYPLYIDSYAYYMRRNYLNDILVSCNIALYIFSSLTNVIVIIVFFKDGFTTTSNISFFALGIADLLLSIVFTANIWTAHTQLHDPFDPVHQYIARYADPWVDALSTICSWITAIVTWERFFCIAFPLKVKRIFTRTLVVCLILAAVVYEVSTMTLYFIADELRIKAHMEVKLVSYYVNGRYRFNITGGENIDFLANLMNSSSLAAAFIPNNILYGMIILGTVLLVIVFWRRVRERKTLTADKGDQGMSVKDKKVIKSVIAICVIYIVTSTPLNIYYTNFYTSVLPLDIFLLDKSLYLIRALNHGGNLFVYLAVNSNFRKQCRQIFCLPRCQF